MASNVELSPTIFDRMLGFAHTPGLPRPPPEPRYYACEQVKTNGLKRYVCRQGKPENTRGCRIMTVAAACPSWNDQLVLAQKLDALVSIEKPLGAEPPASQT